MKKITLVFIFSCLFLGISFGQTTDMATATKIANQIAIAKQSPGSHLISNDKGIELYAVVENGKISSYTAKNSTNKPLKVNYGKPTVSVSAEYSCQICIDTDGGTVCYDINCKDLPKPTSNVAPVVMEATTQKTSTNTDSTNIDVTTNIDLVRNKSGKQLILSNNKYKLYAVIEAGKVTSFSATSLSGIALTIKYPTVMARSKCQGCIKDTNGDWDCFDVDCKDIPTIGTSRPVLKQ